ncbi:MAG: hypothetical protein ACLSAP_00720 [Oscillospiraceae bacterium]
MVDNSAEMPEEGGGASKISGYVRIISQLPETVEALTGHNVMEKLFGQDKQDAGQE